MIKNQHENKSILDRTTAAFTREQALQLLDCKDFEGTDGSHPGYHGFVPAPTPADTGKVLGANGQWVENGSGGSGDTVAEGGGISIITDPQTGVKTISVNAGSGLSIDPDTGELNADAQALEPATTTAEPTHYSDRGMHALKPVFCNRRSRCNETPMHCNWRVAPASCSWSKPTGSNKDPEQ